VSWSAEVWCSYKTSEIPFRNYSIQLMWVHSVGEVFVPSIPPPTYWWPRRDWIQQYIIRHSKSSGAAPIVLDRTASLMVHHDTDNVTTSPAPSTCKQTSTACVSGGTRLHYSHRPPFITDQLSKCRFLNDTGLHLCVFLHKLIPQRRSRIHYDHCAANGTTILTRGWLPLSLNLGWRREPTHGTL
jgi:hypothetical protein